MYSSTTVESGGSVRAHLDPQCQKLRGSGPPQVRHHRFHVVFLTANCKVEINAFSAYGDTNCNQNKHPWQDGYVKLGGEKVWQGSWCGSSRHSRGVIILVIDPTTCTKKEYYKFDTYDNADEAAKLLNYLQLIAKGRVIG